MLGGSISSPSAPQHNGTDRTPQGEVKNWIKKQPAHKNEIQSRDTRAAETGKGKLDTMRRSRCALLFAGGNTCTFDFHAPRSGNGRENLIITKNQCWGTRQRSGNIIKSALRFYLFFYLNREREMLHNEYNKYFSDTDTMGRML